MKTRSFSCAVEGCHKSYRNEADLAQHIDFHSTQKSLRKFYACKKCNKEFKTKQGIKEHTYTHSIKKLFKCPEPSCGKAFRQSSQLCNHKKVHRLAREMMIIRSQQEQSTAQMLNELKSKVASTNFSDIDKVILPPMCVPCTAADLPKLNSIKFSI